MRRTPIAYVGIAALLAIVAVHEAKAQDDPDPGKEFGCHLRKAHELLGFELNLAGLSEEKIEKFRHAIASVRKVPLEKIVVVVVECPTLTEPVVDSRYRDMVYVNPQIMTAYNPD
jgi:hypothetical protein